MLVYSLELNQTLPTKYLAFDTHTSLLHLIDHSTSSHRWRVHLVELLWIRYLGWAPNSLSCSYSSSFAELIIILYLRDSSVYIYMCFLIFWYDGVSCTELTNWGIFIVLLSSLTFYLVLFFAFLIRLLLDFLD